MQQRVGAHDRAADAHARDLGEPVARRVVVEDVAVRRAAKRQKAAMAISRGGSVTVTDGQSRSRPVTELYLPLIPSL